MREYYLTHAGLILAVPEDWQQMVIPGRLAAWHNAQNPATSLVIRIIGDAIDPYAAALDAYTEQQQQGEAQLLEGYIRTYPAVIHTYTWQDTLARQKVLQQQLFLRATDHVFCLTFGTLFSTADMSLPLFAQIMQSIRCVPPIQDTWAAQVRYGPNVVSS